MSDENFSFFDEDAPAPRRAADPSDAGGAEEPTVAAKAPVRATDAGDDTAAATTGAGAAGAGAAGAGAAGVAGAGAGQDGAASGKKKKRWRDRWLLLTILGLLFALLASIAVVGVWYAKSVADGLDKVQRNNVMSPVDYEGRPAAPKPKAGQKHAPLNILLMGADRRTPQERGRSDVLMIMHISGDRKSVSLVSLPRDYWVPIPGHGTAKINAAYSWGGPALTIRTVEQLMNIRIDHTAWIDFDGFMKVIDTLGGIQVYNRYESSNGGVHFAKGWINLNGYEAIRFVRNRYDLPNGDFDRSQRQRDVIMAVVDKLAGKGVLANPGKFREAVNTLGPNFTVDPAFTNKKILELGASMRINNSADINSILAPLGPFGTSSDGQWYVNADHAKLKLLATSLRNDTMDQYQG